MAVQLCTVFGKVCVILSLLIMSFVLCQGTANDQNRPHIIIIVADDLVRKMGEFIKHFSVYVKR